MPTDEDNRASARSFHLASALGAGVFDSVVAQPLAASSLQSDKRWRH